MEKQKGAWVKLPCTDTQEDLPKDSNKVAAIDKKRWDCLDKIKVEVNTSDNIEVTLFIGGYCVKA